MSNVTNKSRLIDIDMLTMALQAGDLDTAWWLDLRSGHVIPAPEADGDSAEQKLIALKRRQPERFIEIEPIAESIHVELMESYVATLEQQDLMESLYQALQRKRPTWHFRNALASAPESEDNWYAYKEQFYALQARQWLRDRGLEPTADEQADAGIPAKSTEDAPPCMELLLSDMELLRRYVIWFVDDSLRLVVFVPDHNASEQMLASTTINEHQLTGLNRIVESFTLRINAKPLVQNLPAILRFNNESNAGELRGGIYPDSPFLSLAEQLDMLLGIPNIEV
jgi:hypothetical protein